MIKPTIILENKYSTASLDKFKKSVKIWKTKDLYLLQQAELFEINNPKIALTPEFEEKQQKYLNSIKKKNTDLLGNWIYYPWSGTLVHAVCEDDYYLLRTNRNRNLVNQEEQLVLKKATIGIVGMSIGSYYSYNLVQSGIGRTLKLVEFDDLSTSNLNRMRAGMSDVGDSKIDIVTKQIYELDPYWDLRTLEKGLNNSNLNNFLSGDKKVDIVFEAIDDLKMKIQLRITSRKKRIPVVMFTNLGDRVMVDIERYDLDPEIGIFNGIIGNVPELILKDKISKENINKYVTKLVGKENTPTRALESLGSIGETLVGRPQLASSVNISGGLSSYVARKILLGEDMPSGRYIVKLRDIFS